jgi:hypothetical protein
MGGGSTANHIVLTVNLWGKSEEDRNPINMILGTLSSIERTSLIAKLSVTVSVPTV